MLASNVNPGDRDDDGVEVWRATENAFGPDGLGFRASRSNGWIVRRTNARIALQQSKSPGRGHPPRRDLRSFSTRFDAAKERWMKRIHHPFPRLWRVTSSGRRPPVDASTSDRRHRSAAKRTMTVAVACRYLQSRGSRVCGAGDREAGETNVRTTISFGTTTFPKADRSFNPF